MSDICRKCGGKMKPGQALTDVYGGSPDFPGDTGNERGCTMNPTGQTKLVDCWKCSECGWSVNAAQEQGGE